MADVLGNGYGSREICSDILVESYNEKSNKLDALLILMQLNDSAFPTGAFTHSLGYESSVRRLFVTDKSSLEAFVIMTLENLASGSIPYVRDSYQCSKDTFGLSNLDDHYASTHSNHLANRASKQQGRSFLHAACQTFNVPLHREYQSMIESNKMQGFQEIIFGAIYASLGVSLEDTLQSFMFSVLRTIVSSVVRLGRILGTLEAQEFQFQLQKRIPGIIERNVDKTTDDVCLKFPIPDLMQCSHDTLFNRMFYS